MIAREAGLEPLADTLLADPTQDPQTVAAGFVNEQVADAAAALEGARAILVERFAEDADLIGGLRERMWTRGRLVTRVREGKESEGVEVHRLLRLRRGVHHAAVAPDPGRVPRREGGRARRRPGARRRAGRARGGHRLRAHHRGRLRHRRPGPPGRPVARSTRCAGPGAPASCCTWASTSGSGCARSPRRARSACSPPTCATCCSPRPPAAGRRWAWTPACAPG